MHTAHSQNITACTKTHWGQRTFHVLFAQICLSSLNEKRLTEGDNCVSLTWEFSFLVRKPQDTHSEGGNAVKPPAHTWTHKELCKHTAPSLCPYHFLSKYNTAALKCLQKLVLKKRKRPSNKLLCAVYKRIHTLHLLMLPDPNLLAKGTFFYLDRKVLLN